MAKVKHVCPTCKGEGVVPRWPTDPLATNPFTKGILGTFPNETCGQCWGDQHVMLDTDIQETPTAAPDYGC